MRKLGLILVIILSVGAMACGTAALGPAKSLIIRPTTTLQAETGNNTSAAEAFQNQPNGNVGAANISKVSIRKLLYAGANTPIYAHMMVWWGDPGHVNVGYTSADPNQVRLQVEDMMSRGIEGAIIDWYGPNNTKDLATQHFMKEAEVRNGAFKFAVTVDKGAVTSCASTPGCDVTQALIGVLTYAYRTYEHSLAYIRIGGRPVVPFFGLEAYSNIDWAKVRVSVPGNPIFVWRNAGGFTKPYSEGSFAWVGLDSNMGLAYLDDFYRTSLSHPNRLTMGSAYKGFNDTLASWSEGRTLPTQNCGQTWITTLKQAGKHYSSSNQLDAIQLVTWNDYEEGTEMETGIDNCVTVAGSVAGSKLNWSISGSQSTLDHFTVFISKDGHGLMPLGDYPASQRSLDLDAFGIPAGQYYFYIKAVAQPTLTNKMSAAIPFTKVDIAAGTAGAVTINRPANNATVSSPIEVAASAKAPSGRRIIAMKIYRDGVEVHSVQASSVNTTVPAAAGIHEIGVNAWDTAGSVYTSTVQVNVK